MKIHREGNKVIVECEESDCPPDYTPEMMADSFIAGWNYGKKAGVILPDNIREDVNNLLKPVIEEAQADFNERWEILPKPLDPPIGGEEAR